MHGVTGSAAGGGYSTALDLLTYVKAVRAGRFPNANPEMGIGGGAPGINAIIEARGEWVGDRAGQLRPTGRRRPRAWRSPTRWTARRGRRLESWENLRP